MLTKVKDAAKLFIGLGLPVTPVVKKVPKIEKWNTGSYSTTEDVDSWDNNYTGFGLVVRDGIVVLDFDDIATFNTAVEGILDMFDTSEPYIQKSGKGFHIVFKSEDHTVSKMALATDSGGNILIEIPIQAVMAPSPHYTRDGFFDKDYTYLSGDISRLPVLSKTKTDDILNYCRSFGVAHKSIVAIRSTRDAGETKSSGYTHPAAELFNSKYSVEEILSRNGYEKHEHKPCYRRPNSTSGAYGINILNDGVNEVAFSHHAPHKLDSGKPYDAFNLMRLLEFDGDYARAYQFVDSDCSKPSNMKLNMNTSKVVGFRPASELMEKEFKPIKFYIDGIIAEGLTVLGGASKIGKSWMLHQMCACIVEGKPFLGHRTEKAACLHFALEDSDRRLQDRINKQGLLTNLDDYYPLDFKSLPPLNSGGKEVMERAVKEIPNLGVIFVDTLEFIRGEKDGVKASKNAYQVDVEFLRHIQNFAQANRLAVVLVTHINKAGNDDVQARITGSNGITGTADTNIVLMKERNDLNAKMYVNSREFAEHEMLLLYNEERCIWELPTMAEDGALKMDKVKRPLTDTIFTILNTFRDGQTISDIKTFLETDHDTIVSSQLVKNGLARLKVDGRVANLTRGKWTPVN